MYTCSPFLKGVLVTILYITNIKGEEKQQEEILLWILIICCVEISFCIHVDAVVQEVSPGDEDVAA